MCSTPPLAVSAQAIATSAPSVGSSHNRRASGPPYQPRPARPSNTSMNDTRYSASGTIHRNGIDAMFCVMCVVTANRKADGNMASIVHSA
jgi:hypothetical protein